MLRCNDAIYMIISLCHEIRVCKILGRNAEGERTTLHASRSPLGIESVDRYKSSYIVFPSLSYYMARYRNIV